MLLCMRVIVQTAGARHAAACWNRYLWWRQQGRAARGGCHSGLYARELVLETVETLPELQKATLSLPLRLKCDIFLPLKLIRSVDGCFVELFSLWHHILSSAVSFWHFGSQKSFSRGFISAVFRRCDTGLKIIFEWTHRGKQRVAEIIHRVESSLCQRVTLFT